MSRVDVCSVCGRPIVVVDGRTKCLNAECGGKHPHAPVEVRYWSCGLAWHTHHRTYGEALMCVLQQEGVRGD